MSGDDEAPKRKRSDRRRKKRSRENPEVDSDDAASDGGFVLILMAIAVAIVIGALLWFLTSSKSGNLLGGSAVRNLPGVGRVPVAGGGGGAPIGPMRPAVTIETNADTVTALKHLANQYSSNN